MNMFEEARALRGMLNMCTLTQSEIAKKIGVSQSYVANKIRLLNFSEELQKYILDARLTERHARILLKIKDENITKSAIDKIKAMNLSVAASEALVDNMLLDNMPKSLKCVPSYERIIRFEQIIDESIKNLLANGISVKRTVDFFENKKYITICIDKQEEKWNIS